MNPDERYRVFKLPLGPNNPETWMIFDGLRDVPHSTRRNEQEALEIAENLNANPEPVPVLESAKPFTWRRDERLAEYTDEELDEMGLVTAYCVRHKDWDAPFFTMELQSLTYQIEDTLSEDPQPEHCFIIKVGKVTYTELDILSRQAQEMHG